MKKKSIWLHSGYRSYKPLIERTDSISRFYKDVNHIPEYIDEPNDETLLVEYQTANPTRKLKIRDIVVQRNIKLCISMARDYCTINNELQDLIEEGAIGLMEAIENFDIKRNSSFCKLALFYIARRINLYKNNEGSLVRNRCMSKIASPVRKIKEDFYQKMERYPTNDEIYEIYMQTERKTKISRDGFIDITVLPVDSYIMNDNEKKQSQEQWHTVYNTKTSTINTCEKKFNEEEQKSVVEKFLNFTTPREKQVLMLYYGLGEDKFEHTFASIGDLLGITSMRANQLYLSGIKKMQEAASNAS